MGASTLSQLGPSRETGEVGGWRSAPTSVVAGAPTPAGTGSPATAPGRPETADAMTNVACEEAGEAALPTTEAQPAVVEVRRRKRWQGFLVAVGSLVAIFGVALGVMVAGEVIGRAFDPRSRVDIFAAAHNHWVVGVVLAITVLWLLPPYPWAKRAVAAGSLDQTGTESRWGGGRWPSTGHRPSRWTRAGNRRPAS